MNCRATIVALALALAASTAHAQNALDNNIQRGSGGTNTGVRKERPGAYQDALVTGNVGGLHRFRGGVDYRAPGEFSQRTSADDSFRFRLHSLPPSQHGVQKYQRPDVLPRSSPGANYLLRPGSGVTAGEVTGQYERFGGGTVRRDDSTAMSARRPRIGGALEGLRSEAAMSLDSAAVRDQSIAIRADEEGSLYEVVASPLRGVRQREIGRALQLRKDELESEETEASEKAEPVSGQQGRRIEDVIRPLSNLIGERLRPVERKGGGAATLLPYRYTPSELEEAVLRPGDTFAVASGADVYYDLLRRVRGDGGDEPYRPIVQDRLGEPKKQAARRGTLEQEVAAEVKAAAEQAAAQGQGAEAEKAAFERLVERLKYDVTLKTLVSGTGTAFDKAMAGAEAMMSEGRYFEAEAAYGVAMTQPLATPLAAIGQSHAQIGAGLYVTASQALRRVFENRPELIAARYTSPVMPGERRLKDVAADLEDSLKETKSKDLLLLSAYLAYQSGDKDGVTDTLATMAEQDSDDTLVPLLQRIWSEARQPQPREPAGEPRDAPKPPPTPQK